MTLPRVDVNDEGGAHVVRITLEDDPVRETKRVYTKHARKAYLDHTVTLELDEYGYVLAVEISG